jgi:hypothetical protein
MIAAPPVRSLHPDATSVRGDDDVGLVPSTNRQLADIRRGRLGERVGLEDCGSLEVTPLPIGELHARRLRAVIPAAQVPAPRNQ